MSSTNNDSAEKRFRAAFDRLKKGKPEVIPEGSEVTQNNVSREAGCNPTALKKNRFPMIVEEIQAYKAAKDEGKQHKARSKRANARSLKQRLLDTQVQRDQLCSQVASLQNELETQQEEIARLKSHNVTDISMSKR